MPVLRQGSREVCPVRNSAATRLCICNETAGQRPTHLSCRDAEDGQAARSWETTSFRRDFPPGLAGQNGLHLLGAGQQRRQACEFFEPGPVHPVTVFWLWALH